VLEGVEHNSSSGMIIRGSNGSEEDVCEMQRLPLDCGTVGTLNG
jgi:hypothetical protein